MADRYWVGGNGTWDATTTHWSASSGGASGASAPSSSDNVFIDGNSASIAGWSINVSGSRSCANLDMTGMALGGTLNASPAATLSVNGTLTFPSNGSSALMGSGLTLSLTGGSSGNIAIARGAYTAGNNLCKIKLGVNSGSGFTFSLSNPLECTSLTVGTSGKGGGTVFTTNNNAITLHGDLINLGGTTTLTFGTSVVSGIKNITFSDWDVGTFSAASATFNCDCASTSFYEFGQDSYGTVNIAATGSIAQLSQGATFGTLAFSGSSLRDIQFGTAGRTFTCTTLTLPASFGKPGDIVRLGLNESDGTFATGNVTLSVGNTVDFKSAALACLTKAGAGTIYSDYRATRVGCSSITVRSTLVKQPQGAFSG